MVIETLQRASRSAQIRAYRFLFPQEARRSEEDTPRTRFLRPLMTPEQKGRFLCVAAIWFLALASFWAWWLERQHIAGLGRFFFNTALVFWATVSPAYFVLIFWRSRVADALPELPADWRVAMVVTKAPSEPFAVARRTLEAMLGQAYPHDTWLADEDPAEETIAWCRQHGVRISTRKGIAAYHQPGWPRRTRCKEGNLAYFYDHYGYQLYDFVVQLDADHVPADHYLVEMLRPFRDPRVGYVSAPSICDTNAAESWSARGRLYVEGGLHGALQAGYNGGLAPLCIGSHYGVRTSALKEIGGIGPELAEDHSTTLIMNGHGWRGVHAFNAIANGEGPPTFVAMITQEFQWARSLSVILFRYTKDHFGGLSPRLKAQFLYSQLWYPLFSLFMACSVLAPILALVTRHSWAAVFYTAFFVHNAIVTLTIIGLMLWIRRNGWFRPAGAKVVSWEGMLFTFARWPWSLMGVLIGAYAGITRRELPFKVTPKGGNAAATVPPGVVLPYVGLSILCALPVLLIDRPGTAGGFYLISLLNAAIYLTIAMVIIVMHRRENPSSSRASSRGFLGGRSRVLNGFGILCATALILSAGRAHLVSGAEALLTAEPVVPGERSTAGAQPGKPMFNFGVYDPQGETAAAGNLSVSHIFLSWVAPDARPQLGDAFGAAAARGRWLLLTLEPWAEPGTAAPALLGDVSAGRYDDRIDALCSEIGRQTRIAGRHTGVFVRWGHEMEQPISRYPWQSPDAKAYVSAYRHFVTRCRSQINGARDVYFVWSPAGNRVLARYYPGSAYVDWIGLSVYSCAFCQEPTGRSGESFADIAGPKYRRVRAYGKPVMIAEMGSDADGRRQLAWLKAALQASCDLPHLRLLVYFDALDTPGVWGQNRPDWRLRPEAREALSRANAKALCPPRGRGANG